MWCRFVCALLVASLAAVLPVPAFAALGGDIQSVERDRVKMKAAITVRQMVGYTIHEMASDSATVREFATPEGKVFAVAWQGPFQPDYQQLLGTYFDQLQQAIAQQQAAGQRHGRRAPVTIRTPEFVFQSFGHLRNLSGRAYVPQMVPANVGVEVIK